MYKNITYRWHHFAVSPASRMWQYVIFRESTNRQITNIREAIAAREFRRRCLVVELVHVHPLMKGQKTSKNYFPHNGVEDNMNNINRSMIVSLLKIIFS